MLPASTSVDMVNYFTSDVNVEVKGEVVQQQVYTLPVNSTIGDLMKLVELTDKADTDNINYNTILKNNDVILVPQKKETSKVSINYGTKEELMTLPRIGEAMAERIIEYRNSHGLFQKLEDITNVKGIGEKTFEKMKDLIQL